MTTITKSIDFKQKYDCFHVSKYLIWRKIYHRYKSKFLFLILKDKSVFFVINDYVYHDKNLNPNIQTEELQTYRIHYTGLILNLNHCLIGMTDHSCKYDRVNCSFYHVLSYIEHILFGTKDYTCCICHKNICDQHVLLKY